MSDNLLSGGQGGSGWDQTLLSSNPFESHDASPSPLVGNVSNSKSRDSQSSIDQNNRNNRNNRSKQAARQKSKENINKTRPNANANANANAKTNNSSQNDSFLLFDENPTTNNNNNNNNNYHNVNNNVMNNTNQNNDNSGIDDILGMLVPSNGNGNGNGNGNTNTNANMNVNDNPFLSFDDNPFADTTLTQSNNNNYNVNNNNNIDNVFDIFEPSQPQTSTNNNNNNSNNNNNNNNNNIGNGMAGSATQSKREKDKTSNKKSKGKRQKSRDDDDSKSEYSTSSSVVSEDEEEEDSDSSSRGEGEANGNLRRKSKEAGGKDNNDGTNKMMPPPKQPSRQRLDSKRHSAPVKDVESVSNKLKSEGLIPERKYGVDPRSPGVGGRIRSEKYLEEKENDAKSGKLRRPTTNAPTAPATDGAKMKSPSASSSSSSSMASNGKSKAATDNKPKEFEVLPELKRGTALLKYTSSKHSYPHFRQFNLSEDNTALRWFSSKKKLEKSEIKMKDIHDVITGQHTKEFERVKWTTLTPASFSIIYGDSKKSLNLVAKSVDEMKMWVEALRYLRNEARKGSDLSKIKSVKVSVDFRDRNRPQSRKHSGNFLRSHETKEKEINVELKNKLISDLATLRTLFNAIEKEANNEIVQASAEFVSISQILSEIQERIDELDKEVRNTRNTKIAENDVWRTKIDLESLREKIRVLYKNNKNKTKRRFSVF